MRIFLTETWDLRISFFCSAPPSRRVCCLFPPGSNSLSLGRHLSEPCPCVPHAPALCLCGDHLLQVQCWEDKTQNQRCHLRVLNRGEEWLPSTFNMLGPLQLEQPAWAWPSLPQGHSAGLCSTSWWCCDWFLLITHFHSYKSLSLKRRANILVHTSQYVGVFRTNLLKWTKCKNLNCILF